MKDILFLLKPDFEDQNIALHGERYYCPFCAAIEGVLAYYPQLRTQLEIIYVDFLRPRTEIVAQLGEQNQGCPVLVVNNLQKLPFGFENLQTIGDKKFIKSVPDLMAYLAMAYGVGTPHP